MDTLQLIRKDSKLSILLDKEIRKPGGEHEWCMVCEVEQFKKWGIKMEEIKDFRTKTELLVGTNPYDKTPFSHKNPNGKGSGPSSGLFHKELREIITSSNNINEFNQKLLELIEDWSINRNLLPKLIKR